MQAYLDNIKTKTGKTVSDFRVLAETKGLAKSAEIVSWLKDEFALGHGHARAVAACLTNPVFGQLSADDKLAALFGGARAPWQKPCVALIAKVSRLGPDIEVLANQTYINLNRGKKKFAIIAPSSATTLDVGLKLVGTEPSARLQAAGSWNAMVTHRVRVSEPKQLGAELLGWLKEAYERA